MNERHRKIMRLRKKGFEVADIATAVGVSAQAVHACITRNIQQINDEHTIDSVKAIEIARLEDVHRVYYPKAMKGDEDAARMVMQVHDRKAKMFGLHKEVFDANLTVGLVGVLASLSGRPDPLGEGAIEHSSVEAGPSSIREGSDRGGTGSLAGGDAEADGPAQLSFDPEWARGGEIGGAQLDDPVVDDVLLPSEGSVHSAEQPPDVRRAVGGAGNVATEDAPSFKVRLPTQSR